MRKVGVTGKAWSALTLATTVAVIGAPGRSRHRPQGPADGETTAEWLAVTVEAVLLELPELE